jgi:dienelactone hydrolase
MKIAHIFLWSCFLLINGCSYQSAIVRIENAEQQAKEYDWQRSVLETNSFELVSYVPTNTTKAEILTVYIEGDGFAWKNSHRASSDPTPHNPVALNLALKHPKGAAAYLARPCQYHIDLDNTPLCTQSYWTNKRYSKEVVDASEQALTQLKESVNAKQLILIGYSGGATIAALLAAQRNDVIQLITVAGNLNHQAWTTLHNLSPLTGSLNPADYRDKLQTIPQIHFVGKDDKNIPPKLTQDFIAGYDSAELSNVIVVPKQSHGCCWQGIWQSLIFDKY